MLPDNLEKVREQILKSNLIIFDIGSDIINLLKKVLKN